MTFDSDALPPVSGPAPVRSVPKFVPTLTETIGLPSTAQAVPTSPAVAEEHLPSQAFAQPESTAHITQALLAQIGPNLEKLVSDAVARVVHEYTLGLAARVRAEVAHTVREHVARQLLTKVPDSEERS